MQQLLPPPSQFHGQQAVFVSKDLSTCSHVFLRTDAIKKSLQPPYEGPYEVLSRSDKVFKIMVRGRPTTVNIDRLKPAYIENTDIDHSIGKNQTAEARDASTSSPATEIPTENTLPPVRTTRSGRRVHFNPKYL